MPCCGASLFRAATTASLRGVWWLAGATKGLGQSEHHGLGDSAVAGRGAMPAISEPSPVPLGSPDPEQSPRCCPTESSWHSPRQGKGARFATGKKTEIRFPGNKKPWVLLEALAARSRKAVFSCTGRSMHLLGRDKARLFDPPHTCSVTGTWGSRRCSSGSRFRLLGGFKHWHQSQKAGVWAELLTR